MMWKLLKAPFTSPHTTKTLSVSLIQGDPRKKWLILQMKVMKFLFSENRIMSKTILLTFATRKPKRQIYCSNHLFLESWFYK